jgi:hypothetical protein
VIVATNDVSIAAVTRETQTISIVTSFSSEPVRTGFVASLARRGGNMTGLCTISTDRRLARALRMDASGLMGEPAPPFCPQASFAVEAQGPESITLRGRGSVNFRSRAPRPRHRNSVGSGWRC